MTATLYRITRLVSAVLVAGLVMAGCSTDRTSDSQGITDVGFAPAVSSVGFVSDNAAINNHNVHFDGRVYANNQTTFSYTVTQTGSSSMSHFTIELPACAGAPSSYSPTGGANINTNQSSGIYGLEWHSEGTTPGSFSITFPGDVALGLVRAEVKTENGTSGVGAVYGPCAGYHISGNVFVDADKNGGQTPEENGIAGVTVSISNGTASTSALTDATGSYDFLVASGSYTVSVDASTAASDFNEDLYASFTSHSATAVSKTVGPNATVNFAFSPQDTKLINDFSTGVLTTNGKPAKFWQAEYKNAAAGRATTYSSAQLMSFLTNVSAIGRTLPFAFTAGSEFKEAAAILGAGTNDPVIKMKKQLLASEINYVSGNTLVNEADLHLVILLWSEEILVQYLTPTGGVAPTALAGGGTKATPLTTGTTLLGLTNGSTGGGGGDE